MCPHSIQTGSRRSFVLESEYRTARRSVRCWLGRDNGARDGDQAALATSPQRLALLRNAKNAHILYHGEPAERDSDGETLFSLRETIRSLTSRYDKKSCDFVPRTKSKYRFADTEEILVLFASDAPTQHRAFAVKGPVHPVVAGPTEFFPSHAPHASVQSFVFNDKVLNILRITQ